MAVILQHYYLVTCERCGWENDDQYMTESAAVKAFIRHHNAEHSSEGRKS